MGRLRYAIGFLMLAVVGYFVFGIVGQLSALLILGLGQEPVTGSWALVFVGAAMALAMPLLARRLTRRGQRVHWALRWAMACTAAFFASAWILAGLPDWSPFPMLGGFALCFGCALWALVILERAAERPAPEAEAA